MTPALTKESPPQCNVFSQAVGKEVKSRDWEALHAEDRQAATAVVGILLGIFTAALIFYSAVVLWIVARAG